MQRYRLLPAFLKPILSNWQKSWLPKLLPAEKEQLLRNLQFTSQEEMDVYAVKLKVLMGRLVKKYPALLDRTSAKNLILSALEILVKQGKLVVQIHGKRLGPDCLSVFAGLIALCSQIYNLSIELNTDPTQALIAYSVCVTGAFTYAAANCLFEN
jgi:hypothetical protein